MMSLEQLVISASRGATKNDWGHTKQKYSDANLKKFSLAKDGTV